VSAWRLMSCCTSISSSGLSHTWSSAPWCGEHPKRVGQLAALRGRTGGSISTEGRRLDQHGRIVNGFVNEMWRNIPDDVRRGATAWTRQ
jgi:hypothetical protein